MGSCACTTDRRPRHPIQYALDIPNNLTYSAKTSAFSEVSNQHEHLYIKMLFSATYGSYRQYTGILQPLGGPCQVVVISVPVEQSSKYGFADKLHQHIDFEVVARPLT